MKHNVAMSQQFPLNYRSFLSSLESSVSLFFSWELHSVSNFTFCLRVWSFAWTACQTNNTTCNTASVNDDILLPQCLNKEPSNYFRWQVCCLHLHSWILTGMCVSSFHILHIQICICHVLGISCLPGVFPSKGVHCLGTFQPTTDCLDNSSSLVNVKELPWYGVVLRRPQRPHMGHTGLLEWPKETSGSYFRFPENSFWDASKNQKYWRIVLTTQNFHLLHWLPKCITLM